MEVTQSSPTLCDPPHVLYSSWNSPGQNTGLGGLSLLQGIFPTHGSNPVLLHCRKILYQLRHKGSPRVLECAAYPFSSRSSWPRNWTGVSCIADRFFTNWPIREAQLWQSPKIIAVFLYFINCLELLHCFHLTPLDLSEQCWLVLAIGSIICLFLTFTYSFLREHPASRGAHW